MVNAFSGCGGSESFVVKRCGGMRYSTALERVSLLYVEQDECLGCGTENLVGKLCDCG